ncbi:MAG: acetate--CoA ligase family protein [Parcubacteria group bacterium]|jgi:acetyltransferase
MSKLGTMFNPQSIAVVGASPEAGKIGNVLVKNILEFGYAGQVFLVNPKYDNLFEQPCFQSLSDIAEPVELAIIALPAKLVVSVIAAASDKVKNFIVISAGFSETDEDGKERELQLHNLAQEKNLHILGPNCLGYILPEIRLNASFAGGMPEAGNIAFVSQSGALAVAIMDIARQENIKFSSIISVGNKMQLDETELLEHLAADEKTKVIGMYLEGIKDGQKFLEVAQRVSKIKPIVILKAGKTAQAQKAISSHTGALAGSDAIMEAVFEKAGVLRANNLEEFFSLIELISYVDFPRNNKVALVTNAGGPGVLTTDAFGGKRMELENFSQETKNRLREFLPHEGSVENPIDLLGDAMEDRYSRALEILENQVSDTIVCILTPQDQTPVARIADIIIEHKNKSTKKIVTIFIGGERVEKEIRRMKENGVVNFAYPDQAIGAIDAFYEWGQRKEKNIPVQSIAINEERQLQMQAIIQKAKDENRGALLFSEAKEIMAQYGIPTPYTVDIHDGEVLPGSVEFPVVMKVNSDKVLHKTDKQGLILNIKNQEELEQAYATLRGNFPGENFIIQAMLENKTELILGIKKDSVFGSIVVFGLGGIYTEVFQMVNFLVYPESVEEVRAAIIQSKIKFLFEETRGQAPYDIQELAEILFGLAQLAREIEEVAELDINPLFIYNNNKKAVAVDVKIII